MDLQHPCTLIWDGSQTEVCAAQWTSCWTEEKCNNQKPQNEQAVIETPVDEEVKTDEVDPKSSFNVDSLYLPMFILMLYLNNNH